MSTRKKQKNGSNTQEYPSCSACGKLVVSPDDARSHPVLGTLQCITCSNSYYLAGDLSKYRGGVDRNGQDNYCRWCLDGGDLTLCSSDNCRYGFCETCIKRNFGEKGFSKISESNPWYCFACDESQLSKLRMVAPTPAIPTPAIPTPAIPTPAIPTPAISTPAAPKPAISTPATPKPAIPTVATPKPAILTPAISNPAAPKLAVQTPVISKPATPKLALSKPAKSKAATPRPAILMPVTQTPATPKPATLKPATPKPSISKPVTPKPATPKPATPKPATSKPGIPTPATSTPATPTPATPKPATPKPAIPTPAIPTPAIPTPATSTPATPTPATPKPAISKPAISKLTVSKPATPIAATPTSATPKPTTPKLATPTPAISTLATPKPAPPRPAIPKTATPKPATPTPATSTPAISTPVIPTPVIATPTARSEPLATPNLGLGVVKFQKIPASFSIFSTSRLIPKPRKKELNEVPEVAIDEVTAAPASLDGAPVVKSSNQEPNSNIDQLPDFAGNLEEELYLSDESSDHEEYQEAIESLTNTQVDTPMEVDVVDGATNDNDVINWAVRDAEMLKKRLKIHLDALSQTYETFDSDKFRADPKNLTSWLSNVETFLTCSPTIADRCQDICKFLTSSQN